MKFSYPVAALAFAICAMAAPAQIDEVAIEERQFSFPSFSTKGSISTTKASGSTSTVSSSGSSGTNDVVSKAACQKVTMIFARGTGESATMGYVVGPGLASNLKTATGSAAIQGLDYPADAAGNANQGASGGPTMAKLAAQALQQCPDTKVVLAGYSQGAMVVHNAMSNSAIPAGKIAAVAIFGDPMNGQGFNGLDSSKIVRYCGTSDSVCNGSGVKNTSGSHTSYGDNVKEAASKVAAIVGVKA